MKKIKFILLFMIIITFQLSGQNVSEDEALTVAKNWIKTIVEKKGTWGGTLSTQVTEIHEFKRDKRVIGYFCDVKPKGFIVLSLRKELAAVKAYSDECSLDPNLDQGLIDVFKGGMERILNVIEKQTGSIQTANVESVKKLLEINYQQSWDELLKGPMLDHGNFKLMKAVDDYTEGEILLRSSWHQNEPYNLWCPGADGCNHCVAGCTAIAGAQVMYYWNWPPFGKGHEFDDSYNWSKIVNRYISTVSGYVDENGNTITQVQIDAVAELCHEVGYAVDMNYGCESSSAYFANVINKKDLLDAFEDNFRFSDNAESQDRDDYNAIDWFELMKNQLNLNRPIPYTVPDHVIVADGWQENGSTPLRQYHMNYGWGNRVPSPGQPAWDPDWQGRLISNAWYTLDALPGSKKSEEQMIIKLYPVGSLGDTFSGLYITDESFPYRYFNRDATSDGATFLPGHKLQFLPGVKITCTGDSKKIKFYSLPDLHTNLFSHGDQSRGVKLLKGTIAVSKNGSVRMY